MAKYLLLPHMDIASANAQPAWWLVGAPPPMAYLGFVHALERSLQITTQGVSIVHHDFQLLAEKHAGDYLLRPQQIRAATRVVGGATKELFYTDYSSKRQTPLGLTSQPTVRCHLLMSLVIRLADDTLVDKNKLGLFLEAGRIAGGTLKKMGEPSTQDSVDDCRVKLRGGFQLIERMDLMEMEVPDQDRLDTLLRVTRRYSNAQSAASEHSDAVETSKVPDTMSWVMPTTLGYIAVSTIEHRAYSRDSYPHAFVEPLVGLVQYQSLQADPAQPFVFWRYDTSSQNSFIATTKE